MTEERYEMVRRTLAPGWVYFTPGDPPPPPARVPAFLNLDLIQWLKENKQVKIRATLPMVENGNTVAIHVWYD